MKYKKIKQKPIKVNLNLPELLQPEDLGRLNAMAHAEMMIEDYVPSNNNNKDKWN